MSGSFEDRESNTASDLRIFLYARRGQKASRKKLAEHCANAAMGCYLKTLERYPERAKCFSSSNKTLNYVLEFENTFKILGIMAQADIKGIVTELISDQPDSTDAEKRETFTVLGIGPVDRREIYNMMMA
ncbi:hypothetical protein ACOME3_009398 [Neoechinorhynchus agilis]